jgi:hypothetical protein
MPPATYGPGKPLPPHFHRLFVGSLLAASMSSLSLSTRALLYCVTAKAEASAWYACLPFHCCPCCPAMGPIICICISCCSDTTDPMFKSCSTRVRPCCAIMYQEPEETKLVSRAETPMPCWVRALKRSVRPKGIFTTRKPASTFCKGGGRNKKGKKMSHAIGAKRFCPVSDEESNVPGSRRKYQARRPGSPSASSSGPSPQTGSLQLLLSNQKDPPSILPSLLCPPLFLEARLSSYPQPRWRCSPCSLSTALTSPLCFSASAPHEDLLLPHHERMHSTKVLIAAPLA